MAQMYFFLQKRQTEDTVQMAVVLVFIARNLRSKKSHSNASIAVACWHAFVRKNYQLTKYTENVTDLLSSQTLVFKAELTLSGGRISKQDKKKLKKS